MNQRPTWRFYDFVNGRKENEIKAWAASEGATLKARLNVLINHLETLNRALTRQDNVGLLRKDGPCKRQNFVELLITIGKVEYRPIGWYGPGPNRITLLLGAKEKGGDFEPRNACIQAINRRNLVSSSTAYYKEHEFD
jgi:hypothetical protein